MESSIICICGSHYELQSPLFCKRVCLVTLQYSEFRSLSADVMKEVCKDVQRALFTAIDRGNNMSTNLANQALFDISARDLDLMETSIF